MTKENQTLSTPNKEQQEKLKLERRLSKLEKRLEEVELKVGKQNGVWRQF